MKAYCLDTSGLSTPLEFMPEDIHSSIWAGVADLIAAGKFAVTTEIYEELGHLPGPIGDCIKANEANLQLEIEEEFWDWKAYVANYEEMKIKYSSIVSEYNGNRKNTVGLNDLTIIALAKTLKLPVISSEKKLNTMQESEKRQKIPDICEKEGVVHMSFNDLLRAEGIKS
ncbi:DUF4411 family protein [Bradyrhizobium prioriisuperbiae]|uniref:DUF4411 family protein n=1 Tax=Bradyrhizobium prioriisuperbiae TaxID=2854389 RepID=UPI0028EFAC03|nr:DUF4411 family protein [Bradyrhizobium prioritasuperba]